jgi:hypothetical protein
MRSGRVYRKLPVVLAGEIWRKKELSKGTVSLYLLLSPEGDKRAD